MISVCEMKRLLDNGAAGYRRELIAVTLLLAAAFGLRSWHLTARSVWFDEGFTWGLISFPPLEMLERAARDNNPPFYYVALQIWAGAFGDGLLSLRLFSALAGTLTVLGMYLLARDSEPAPQASSSRLFSGRVSVFPFFAAALVAASILQIRYSAEARMYALGTTLLTMSSWGLLRALLHGAVVWWLFYACMTTLFLYTHTFALFSVAAQVAFLFAYLLRRGHFSLTMVLRDPLLPTTTVITLFIILAWMPWLPVFLGQHAQVRAAFWSRPFQPEDVINVWYQMFVSIDTGEPLSPRVALVVFILSCMSVCVLLRCTGTFERYCCFLGAGPVLLAIIVSALDTNLLCIRYLVFGHLFLVAGCAALTFRIPNRFVRYVTGLVVLLVFLGVDIKYWFLPSQHSPLGARGAAAFIDRSRNDGEPVIVSSPFYYFPVLFHAERRGDLRLYSDGRPFYHYHGAAVITADRLITDAQVSQLSNARVWVISSAWNPNVPPIPFCWVVESSRTFPDVSELGSIRVVEYVSRE